MNTAIKTQYVMGLSALLILFRCGIRERDHSEGWNKSRKTTVRSDKVFVMWPEGEPKLSLQLKRGKSGHTQIGLGCDWNILVFSSMKRDV
jgi:hypothetical protein